MSVRKAISLIKRQEEVKVIVNSRVKISDDYQRTVHNLKDILINDTDNVEIRLNNKIIEIPIKEINNVKCKLTYIVFYEDLRVTLFDFINK